MGTAAAAACVAFIAGSAAWATHPGAATPTGQADSLIHGPTLPSALTGVGGCLADL